MKFSQTSLAGLWVIDLEPREDERGFLARTYCENEFADHGLNTRWPQCNLTLTKKRAMIRGMHFQAEPKPEIKLIRCSAGAIFDVLVDVRRDSPAFGRWQGFELSAENHRTLRPWRLCAWLPMPDRSLRSLLPNVRILLSRTGARA